ncbi:hypothetical protein L9F63_007192 [Diploptera punctata]|uniref:Uncharacterized protein n=1 Tax=Diploptera punctata TaxID=6984 RepID=A0AAD8E3K2_DIPPU|nr:hypothetical protein L9F63_007192 [Diploptera punctata]
MESKHRFNVRRVSETSQTPSDNVMQGVPENEMLELEDSPRDLPGVAPNTYPVNNEPKPRRSSLAQLTREDYPVLITTKCHECCEKAVFGRTPW